MEVACIASVCVGWGAKKDQGMEPERYFARAKLGQEPK